MNFRTTIILLILLIGAGTFFIVANMSPEPAETKVDPEEAERGRKLLDAKLGDVKKLTIVPGPSAPTGSQPLEITKVDGDWRITQPIDWPADAGEAGTFVSTVVDLRSTGTTDVTEAMGLARPRFTIEVTDTAGKVQKLHIGERSALGPLYVQVGDGKGTASVVSDNTLAEKLAKGVNPLVATLRDRKLVQVTTFDARQLQIDAGEKKLQLVKESNAWKLTDPQAIAADTSEVSDILSTITNLRAESFATEESAASGGARFEKPRAVVTISTAAPAATGPATAPATAPAGKSVSVTIGQPTDLTGDKSWVKISDPPSVAIVNLGGPSLEKIDRATILSLRDRRVLDIDPTTASLITLTTETFSATQPSDKQSVTLERRKENLELGPQLPKPAGGAATKPAEPANGSTTKPATRPATKPAASLPSSSGWVAWASTLARAAQPREEHGHEYMPMPPAKPSTLDQIAGMFSVTTLLQAATAPATKPAEEQGLVRIPSTSPATRPAAPATQPSSPGTQPATKPSTQPAAAVPPAPVEPPPPPTQWTVASADGADANDPAVSNLLLGLHPLRATKFLAEMPKPPAGTQPATQPATTVYVLTVKSVAAGGKTETHELRITDRGGNAAPIGQYQDLIFELDQAFVRKLKAEFDDPSAGIPEEPGPPPGMPPGMMPPGLPPGFQMPQ